MNVMMKLGGLFGLFVTICKIVVALAGEVAVIGFVAVHSSFMYGMAAGIIVYGLIRNFWIMVVVIFIVYGLLVITGI